VPEKKPRPNAGELWSKHVTHVRLTEMKDFGMRSRLQLLRLVLTVLLGCCCLSLTAKAMPGFTRQTGQPCVACHVGTLGSPLGPYGRQLVVGYTDSAAGQLAMLVSLTFSGDEQKRRDVTRDTGEQNPDLQLFEGMIDTTPRHDWVLMRGGGFSAPFTLPVTSSGGATMTANELWTDGWSVPRETVANSPWLAGFSPVWRTGWQTDPGHRLPQINVPVGAGDNATTAPAGASWQLNAGSGLAGDEISARLTIVRDPGGANVVLPADLGPHALDALRAEATYRPSAAITPSIQYFRTSGTIAPVDYGWSANRPNSSGVAARIAFAPWSGSGSIVEFLNLRFAAQYVAYTEFSGAMHGSGAISAVFLSFWGGIRF
jgi:hypothetical protein